MKVAVQLQHGRSERGDRERMEGRERRRGKKVKLLMQAPPTDPRTMPAIRMKAQVPCGQQQKMTKEKVTGIWFWFYFSFLQNFTHNAFWFLEDTQGAGFYDKHGTTLHLFVIYIVSRAIHGETFRVETRETMTTQVTGVFKFETFA